MTEIKLITFNSFKVNGSQRPSSIIPPRYWKNYRYKLKNVIIWSFKASCHELRIFFRFLKLIKCLKVNIYYPLWLLMPQRRLTLWRIWSTFDQFKSLRNSWHSREIHMSIEGKEKLHISLSLTWIFSIFTITISIFVFAPNVSWLIVSRFHLPKALRF